LPNIRNISDTALWAARFRALETERPDALFHDPFARKLAGERGEKIAQSMPSADSTAWAWTSRTYLFDQFIHERIAAGADMILNLAAGLDTRPFRMALPPDLRWVEVDLPGILDYKEEILGDHKPACAFERVRMDLADVDARRNLFARLGSENTNVLILSEGLMIYLNDESAGALATDLAAQPSFHHWAMELASPGLLRMIRKDSAAQFAESGVSMQFAPAEGPPFFERFGWRPADVRSSLKAAARLKRLPLFLRMMALLPESHGAQGSRPWSGICLFERR
jgi:methyltransferase (TIGR00027 family)